MAPKKKGFIDKLKEPQNRIVSIFFSVWVIYFLMIYLSNILGYDIDIMNLTTMFGLVDINSLFSYSSGILGDLIYAGTSAFLMTIVEGFTLSVVVIVYSLIIEIILKKKIDFASTLSLLFAISIIISFLSTSVYQVQILFSIGLLILFILLAVGIID